MNILESCKRIGGTLVLALWWAAPATAAGGPDMAGAGAPADADRSCYSLYAEVSELLPRARERETGFFNVRENQIAAAAWLVYPVPASLYLTYSAVTRTEGRLDTAGVNDRIRELRGLLADGQCFVR